MAERHGNDSHGVGPSCIALQGPIAPRFLIARCDGSCRSRPRLVHREDSYEQRGCYELQPSTPSMAPARVCVWAVCVLRVALAAVYFQEEFIDGGEGATPVVMGVSVLPSPAVQQMPDLHCPPRVTAGYVVQFLEASTRPGPPPPSPLSSGKFYGHKEKDKGLQTTQNGRFYAISARFKPFTNKGRTLVLQYTVKHEQKMDCGGGYVKVFPADVDQKNLNRKSQYYIMFVYTRVQSGCWSQKGDGLEEGPNICGFDIKKVHVILHFKNQYHSNKKSIRCKGSL
ncbi:hypothetical protein MC885_009990 [Smutsia gigantea]|nr:hypothetical protein MC885_009990 [Smutsia gigantea]